MTIAIFYFFANGRVKIEIVSLVAIGVIALGLYIFPFQGEARKEGLKLAFAGFGHPALITICSLMIMGRGLVVTGALNPAARGLARVWRINRHFGLLVTLLAAMAMSMIVNDTPVLVLLLPVMAQLAAKGAMPASKTLMPLNAAILIGGMATTIGTSTNLLVVSLANDLGMPELDVFHFTPIVLAAAVVALPYIWLVMPRLLPDNSPEAGHEPRTFFATLRIRDGSPIADKPPSEWRGGLPKSIVATFDGSRPVDRHTRLPFKGSRVELEEIEHRLVANAAPNWLIDRMKAQSVKAGEDLVEAEMAITRDSRLIGLTLQTSGIEDVAILGISPVNDPRDERPQTAEAALAEGDVLLAVGLPDRIQQFAIDEGLLLLEGIRELPRSAKAALALVIMGVAVALASTGILPIAISALGGAIAMFATRCVRFDRVGRALSAKVIVLVAASLAIGRVVLESGAAAWLGNLLALGLQFLPAWGVLAAIMIFVTVLTNFASNATAAAVGTPIAFTLAQSLGLPVEPLVLAVLFGCNLCYATPIAYQTNMLIMAEGDYRFRDYLRGGIPLVVIMILALSVLLVRQYGL
ncbi:MAG: SLC13 family permease [Sphingomicrobium sp.]